MPGAVVAIQSFGDFLGFNPHCHVLCTDGGFYGKGMFRVAPRFHRKDLEKIFRHKVFKLLLSKGKITQDLGNMLMPWRHSGFNVFCGPKIKPGEQEAMENLARYIIRAFLSRLLFCAGGVSPRRVTVKRSSLRLTLKENSDES